ncbi:MAG: PIN domain nuclease [Bacteroidetes bacterium]|nr:PIN domain nuclease [Bacteroidota bacterium]
MKRIFIDTNILLDLLLERQPWVNQASVLFSMADRKDIKLLCCSLSFSTAIYLMERLKYERKEIITKLAIVKSLCSVTTVDESVIDRVLQSDFLDLEDSLQYYSALSAKADVIVTRNKKDYVLSNIPVLTPSEFLYD